MHFPLVDEIDFLPAGYHQRKRQRRVRGWRWMVAAAFLGLAAAGLGGNRIQETRLLAKRDELASKAKIVSDLDGQSNEIRARVQSLELVADLRALQRLRPSTTRLIVAVTSALPPHTTLTSFQFAADHPPVSDAALTPEQSALPPAQRDIERLTSAPTAPPKLTIRGIAPDDAAVSDYLAAVNRTGFFAEVRLLLTDRHDHDGNDLRAFSAELSVRRSNASVSEPATTTPAVALIDGGEP